MKSHTYVESNGVEIVATNPVDPELSWAVAPGGGGGTGGTVPRKLFSV